ncbi:radical SAM protein [Candidatus Pacearchaeota archaeon]|nr:radical SAM protein [Candidatus Pacearchaeota archaeon]
MIVAGWSFTNACNLRCKHCYNASGMRREDELTFEESLRVADKLKKARVAAVNFGGGECALRPDFIDLCKYLHKIGIKISYTTNGTTFNLIKDNLDLFSDIGVSIDFADKKKHDEFRGVNGVYDNAIETIKELVKAGVDTEIITCLTKLNCSDEELEKLYNLARKLKVNYWRLNRFRANGRGIENKINLELSNEELRKAYEFLSRYVKGNVSEPIFRAVFGGNYYIPGDPSGNTAFRIQVNGEVSPSVFLSESGGNIKNKSVEKIFDSSIFRKIRNRKPRGKCKHCPAYFHCKGGDAGASYLQYGHFDGPDPLCWINPKKAKKATKTQPKNWNVHEFYLCTLYVPINNWGKNGK